MTWIVLGVMCAIIVAVVLVIGIPVIHERRMGRLNVAYRAELERLCESGLRPFGSVTTCDACAADMTDARPEYHDEPVPYLRLTCPVCKHWHKTRTAEKDVGVTKGMYVQPVHQKEPK